LIEVVGNFEEVEPNQAQLDAVVKIMTMLAVKYQVSPDAISGHKDFSGQTVCPGKIFIAIWRTAIFAPECKRI